MNELWIVLGTAGALTFLTRLSFISLLAGREFPPLAMQTLRYVPPAVLTAIVFPELLMLDAQVAVSAGNARLAAGLVAIAVAWRFRNTLATIAAGMLSLWLLQSLG